MYCKPIRYGVSWRYPAGERPVISLEKAATLTWPRLWEIAAGTLRRRGYAHSTLTMYRQVLRQFSRHTACRPQQTTRGQVHHYLGTLASRTRSWSWTALNITVLRTIFDKLGGMSLTTSLRTPKRSHRIPLVLSHNEAVRLLAAAPTVRDQLMLGLMYLAGLKPGELLALRWSDIDPAQRVMRVATGRPNARMLPIPEELAPILQRGHAICPADGWLFPGRNPGAHLSARALEQMVHATAAAAGLGKPVSAMSLRHSFAVNSLDYGADMRAVQDALGHRRLDTTLRYERCLPPDYTSPLDRLRRQSVEPPAPVFTVPLDVAVPVSEFDEWPAADNTRADAAAGSPTPTVPSAAPTHASSRYNAALRQRPGANFLSPTNGTLGPSPPL